MSASDSEAPGQRLQRELAETIGSARPRVEGDLTDADIPVAATVVLLRDREADGSRGVEVLMIRRPERGSFAGAWVFPGGKFEPGDADDLPEGADEAAIALRAGVRETLEETGLVLDPDELVPLSRWDPPPGLPLRIRTWFFLAGASAGGSGEVTLAPDEAVEADWVRPREMLERHSRGEVTLYPPTWVTLHGLDGGDVAALQAEARLAGPRTYATQARRGPSGAVFYWSEDAEYDEDGPAGASGARHRLEAGSLPWVYTRSNP